jgi:hypothetical protein
MLFLTTGFIPVHFLWRCNLGWSLHSILESHSTHSIDFDKRDILTRSMIFPLISVSNLVVASCSGDGASGPVVSPHFAFVDNQEDDSVPTYAVDRYGMSSLPGPCTGRGRPDRHINHRSAWIGFDQQWSWVNSCREFKNRRLGQFN